MTDLVVLVPVLNRPGNVEPLLVSFERSGAPGDLIFIADESDHAEIQAIEEAGASALVTDGLVTWPRKINLGYRETDALWMLLAADDVRFRPGWWEATAELRAAGFGVIGTNDLGNPRVLRGEHATHALVAREYADAQGTIDGPGAVVCDEYLHWFCDDELVATAKARGSWAPCPASIVEHMHPYFRPGVAWDQTYALGEMASSTDRLLWERRRPRIEAIGVLRSA